VSALPFQHKRLDTLAIVIMLMLCTVWGAQQVISKVALSQGMPPFLQATLRSAIAGPLLLGWLFMRRGPAGLRDLFARDGSLWPGLLTGAMFAAEFLLLFPGVRLTSASRSIVLLFSGVFFTAAGAHLFIPHERLRRSQWAGLVLAFVGVAATVGKQEPGGSLLGDLLVVGAAASWGLTAVVVKATPALNRLGSEKVLAYQLFGAFPPLLVVCWAVGELHMPDASGLAWASLAYQGVVIAFASYLTWFWLIARYPAGRVAAFSFLSPLVGVVAAWFLLGDALTPSLLVGLVCVCGGLWLVNR
jgi:drug/metabolite transporter (DMT)-like permease